MLIFTRNAIRRPDAETAVNLAKRRAWFDDRGAAGQVPADDGEVDIGSLPDPVQKYIKSLRKDAESYRLKLREQETAAQQREQARLAEEGKWKELAESRANEISTIKPYQERATHLESLIREGNEQRIGKIPQEMRDLVPTDYPPEKLSRWLDANLDKLLKKPAPSLDGGAAGGGAGGKVATVELNEMQLELAARAGMKPEQYAEYQLKIQNTKAPELQKKA